MQSGASSARRQADFNPRDPDLWEHEEPEPQEREAEEPTFINPEQHPEMRGSYFIG